MTRTLIPALLALATTLAPLALAQDEPVSDGKDEENPAWVEDCPPDMMCAYGGEPSDENATASPDCGGEVCAYDGEPGSLGPSDCIECSRPPADDGSTCMDGAQEGETCRDDVQYLDGRPPDCENCRGDDAPEADPVSAPADDEDAITSHQDAAETEKAVPGAGLTLALLAAAGVAIAFAGRRG